MIVHIDRTSDSACAYLDPLGDIALSETFVSLVLENQGFSPEISKAIVMSDNLVCRGSRNLGVIHIACALDGVCVWVIPVCGYQVIAGHLEISYLDVRQRKRARDQFVVTIRKDIHE